MSHLNPRALSAYKAGPSGGLRVIAATNTAPAEILIYDAIGADAWTGGGVTPEAVIAALAGLGNVCVRINSPGGSVFDGYAIFNALLAHKGAVNVVVEGVAASAASFIAMAGATVTMRETSMLMIHNARTMAFGQAADMLATADLLAKIDGQIAAIYEAKSGNSAVEMMAAETWFTATEAQAAGLCDEIIKKTVDGRQKMRMALALAGVYG